MFWFPTNPELINSNAEMIFKILELDTDSNFTVMGNPSRLT